MRWGRTRSLHQGGERPPITPAMPRGLISLGGMTRVIRSLTSRFWPARLSVGSWVKYTWYLPRVWYARTASACSDHP